MSQKEWARFPTLFLALSLALDLEEHLSRSRPGPAGLRVTGHRSRCQCCLEAGAVRVGCAMERETGWRGRAGSSCGGAPPAQVHEHIPLIVGLSQFQANWALSRESASAPWGGWLLRARVQENEEHRWTERLPRPGSRGDSHTLPASCPTTTS